MNPPIPSGRILDSHIKQSARDDLMPHPQALEAVACSGFSDIITVVHGDSCNVVLPDGAKADIIVHEVSTRS